MIRPMSYSLREFLKVQFPLQTGECLFNLGYEVDLIGVHSDIFCLLCQKRELDFSSPESAVLQSLRSYCHALHFPKGG